MATGFFRQQLRLVYTKAALPSRAAGNCGHRPIAVQAQGSSCRRWRRRLCGRLPTLMATCWLTAPATSAPATSPASPCPAAPCAPPPTATRSGTASSGRDSNASLLYDPESGIHQPLVHLVARLPSPRAKSREQWFSSLGLSVIGIWTLEMEQG